MSKPPIETLSALTQNTLGKIHGIVVEVLPDMGRKKAEAFLAWLAIQAETSRESYQLTHKQKAVKA